MVKPSVPAERIFRAGRRSAERWPILRGITAREIRDELGEFLGETVSARSPGVTAVLEPHEVRGLLDHPLEPPRRLRAGVTMSCRPRAAASGRNFADPIAEVMSRRAERELDHHASSAPVGQFAVHAPGPPRA